MRERKNVEHVVLKKGEDLFRMRSFAPPALCDNAVNYDLWLRIHAAIHPVEQTCCDNVLEVADGVLSLSMKHQAP